MKDFIDKITDVTDGTPINRANMMAVQGFINNTIVFSGNQITETNGDGEVKTTTFDDGIITETFEGNFEGEQTRITKTTTFVSGRIEEVVS